MALQISTIPQHREIKTPREAMRYISVDATAREHCTVADLVTLMVKYAQVSFPEMALPQHYDRV